MKSIYPWQEAALRKWEDSGYHGIFDVVTGAGKTGLALFGVQRLKQCLKIPLTVFIVVPTVVLMDQWVREIRSWFPEESVGRIGSGSRCGDRLSFQIFIVNSARTCLAERRDRLLSRGLAVLLIADECHHYGSKQNRKIFGNGETDFIPGATDNFPAGSGCVFVRGYFTMGLSATPYGMWYREVLCRNLGNCIFTYRHPEALRDRIISDFCIYRIGLGFHGEEARIYSELSDRMAAQYSRLIRMYPDLKTLPQQLFFSQLRSLALERGDQTAAAYRFLMLKRKDLINTSRSRQECAVALIRQLDPAARIIAGGGTADG